MKTLRNITVIFLIILTLFGRMYNYELPYDNEDNYNLNGRHIWLSASTIKFTNIWLSEGPANVKYLMIEDFDSIENTSIESRNPYVSYPLGTIIISYSYAKISGKAEINIYDVRSISKVFYLTDCLLIGLFFYLVLEYILKIKSFICKIILPVILSLLWMILPINVYYLRNIYFSDMAVLPFIFAFICLEILRRYSPVKDKSKGKLILDIIMIIVNFAGCFIDYYFWLLIFTVGITGFIIDIIRKENFKITLRHLCFYAIPAISSAALFIFNISVVSNWKELLLGKAADRLNLGDETVGYSMISYYLSQTYHTIGKFLPFIVLGVTILFIVLNYLEKKKVPDIRTDSLAKMLYISVIVNIPVLLHLAVLMNHWEHEFASIKLGLPVMFCVLSICYLIFYFFKLDINSGWEFNFKNGKKKTEVYLSSFLIGIILLLATAYFTFNISNTTDAYYESRYGTGENYYREIMIANNTDYYDVIFSNTEEILYNPPQYLLVAGKRVYKISSFDEIAEMFPELPENANICFIVSNDYSQKGEAESLMDIAVFENCDFAAIDYKNTYTLYRANDKFWEDID